MSGFKSGFDDGVEAESIPIAPITDGEIWDAAFEAVADGEAVLCLISSMHQKHRPVSS